MTTYIVTLQSETGRQREERVVASTQTWASEQALLRCVREFGVKHTYRVLSVNEAYPVL